MQDKAKPKHWVLEIKIIGFEGAIETKTACLWRGSPFDATFYDDAFFHFSKKDLQGVKRATADLNSVTIHPKEFVFGLFTLLDYKIVGEWA